MELTILVDNNTLIDKCFYGEPGLSFFIEVDNKKILFDTGYSDIFIKNAHKMDIDLSDLDYIVLSHGHNDHTWGLEHLAEIYSKAISQTKPTLIAHPLTFSKKFFDKEEIGIRLTKEQVRFKTNLTNEPFWISEKLVFLGEIPRTNSFEAKSPIGKISVNDKLQDDYVLDDSALVYKSDEGLVIITGCSHAGICNIIEYSKEVCKENKILDIIGGLHLLTPSNEVLQNTISYLKQQNVKLLHPCHCTDLKSKIALSRAFELEEVGVGSVLKYYNTPAN